VLITGANRGIGIEFVKQYADLGWTIIATCRNPDSADELNALAAEHENITVEHLDLVNHEGIDVLAAKYEDQPIDVLVNNAGLMRGPDVSQIVGSIDYDEFDLFYRTNAMGPLKVTEAFSPNILASEQRVIAALTTGQGKHGIPVPGFSLYKTSKAALNSIQKEIAIRWKSRNVKVVTLMPGRVYTHGETGTGNEPNIMAVEDSVSGMIRVIEELTIEQSGHTITWDGELIE
jgi:NAD(P)-dependent dehydrogenase (short-subunit alcohol dehydrogenase family)